MPQSRITITIPPELVEAADRRAGELDRSRSWVLVDALSAYVDRGPAPAARVAEPTAGYAAGLDAGRRTQLEADLELTAEERVLIAEQTLLVADLRNRRPVRDQVVAFERYEDFLGWRWREGIDP